MSEQTPERAFVLDTKRARATQYATGLVHELSEGGYIAPHCMSDAITHLAVLFYRKGIVMTSAEQRMLEAAGR